MTSQVATGVSILGSLNGLGTWSFTNWGASAVSAIAQGSVMEVAGAWFRADSDTAINASSLTAIATGASCYVYVTPSGTAGSQILTPYGTTTAPVWTAKQGYYASAASVSRYIGGMTKLGTSSWGVKWLLKQSRPNYVHDDSGNLGVDGTLTAFAATISGAVTASALSVTNTIHANGDIDTDANMHADGAIEAATTMHAGTTVEGHAGVIAGHGNDAWLKKIIPIGDWNMDSTATVNVAHGLTLSKIVRVGASIIRDGGALASALMFYQNIVGVIAVGGSISWDATNISLSRTDVTADGYFDNANYDATSFNRGWITIEYVP